MGWLGTLGKIASVAGVGAAAPFTGGSSLAALGPILGAAGTIGGVLSKAAGSSAAGRAHETNLLTDRDRVALERFRSMQEAQNQAARTDLERKQFSEAAPLNRARQAALAGALMNYKPTRVSVAGIPDAQISGGTHLGEAGRAGLAEMQKQALVRLLAGEKGESFKGGNLLNAPELSPLPTRSGWEKVAGILGTIGSLGGAVAPFLPRGGGGYTPPSIGLNAGFGGLPGEQLELPELPEEYAPDYRGRGKPYGNYY